MLNKLTIFPILLIVAVITGCDVKNDPLPLKDSPLVGIWEAEKRFEDQGLLQVQRMYVEFTDEGYVAFQRVNCWTETTKDSRQWTMKSFHIDFMPVIKLTKVKLKAQWMPFTPKVEMKLDSWPVEKDGVMTMSIDGMELVAKDKASDRAQWVCENME